MAVSVNEFYSELFEEHLEEASFLYDQRRALFHDPEIFWPDIRDEEMRLEAHIDALVVGEAEALRVCEVKAAEGEAGERHAAVRVFCRQERMDLLERVLNGLDVEDGEGVTAIRDALKYEWPGVWVPEIERLISRYPLAATAVFPAVIGFRRLPLEQLLLNLLPECPEAQLPDLIWSLGRLGAEPSLSIGGLRPYLEHTDAIIGAAAALAMMRMGHPLSMACGAQPAEACDFRTLLQIMLAGGQNDTAFLLDRLNRAEGAGDVALALGVVGDIRAIPPLIKGLDDETAAGSAASALNLMTGAGLVEEVFVPDEVDPDELLAHELEQLDRGEPLYPAGEEPGTTVVRPSQDAVAWQTWWQQNGSRFRTGIRYRNGRPFTPDCLLENLRDESSPCFIRQTAYEELVVRYKIDAHFETDMPVPDQIKAIDHLSALTSRGNTRWQAGKWYYAGETVG